MKICIRKPEGFATEETAIFDITLPEKPKEELKVSIKEKEEINISTNWSFQIDYSKQYLIKSLNINL